MSIETVTQYRAGIPARIDSVVGGMVPCMVLEVLEPGKGSIVGHGSIRVRVTHARPGYRVGEIVIYAAKDIVPRDRIYFRGRKMRVDTRYEWVTG